MAFPVLYFTVIIGVAALSIFLLHNRNRQNQGYQYEYRNHGETRESDGSTITLKTTNTAKKISNDDVHLNRRTNRSVDKKQLKGIQTCSYCRRTNAEEECDVSEYDSINGSETYSHICRSKRGMVLNWLHTYCQHTETAKLNPLNTSEKKCFICGTGISDSQTICSVCTQILLFLFLFLIVLIIIKKI